jgi:hypothetical protein
MIMDAIANIASDASNPLSGRKKRNEKVTTGEGNVGGAAG